MLERDIQIGTDFPLSQDLEQGVPDLLRISVEEANPTQTRYPEQIPEEAR